MDYGLASSTWSPEQWQQFGSLGGQVGSDNNSMNFNGNNTQPSNNWFGKGGYVANGAQGLQALSGLANAYAGFQNLGLAKDQFNFQKNLANRNVANQGKMINNQYQNSGEVGLALAGNTLNDTQRAAERAKTRSKYVNTSAI